MKPKIKGALDAAGVRYTDADLIGLAERAADGVALLDEGTVRLRVCVPAGAPCVTLVRE
jgi:hypothetical protein